MSLVKRSAIVSLLSLCFIVFLYSNFSSKTLLGNVSESVSSVAHTSTTESDHPAHIVNYYDQGWQGSTSTFKFETLEAQCRETKWQDDPVYLQCGGMAAGLTSIMSQVKVCFKMALDAGTGLILPEMPLRSSDDLTNFNFLNGEAYLPYDRWFDEKHLLSSLARVCPQMKVIHPHSLQEPDAPGTKITPVDALTPRPKVTVKNRWNIEISTAPGYKQFESYFWPGRPFRTFFQKTYDDLKALAAIKPTVSLDPAAITVISIASQFLVYRITDDPTGTDLELWNDLGHLIRFLEGPRKITNRLIHQLSSFKRKDGSPRGFYGVHFRTESDTIWSSLEHQLEVDLDALDKAWSIYGDSSEERPLIYLACGDPQQIEKFVSAGLSRGWEVTSKYHLANAAAAASDSSSASSDNILSAINDLPFDFQGSIDMGIMVLSHFFLGISGSAFSSTIANARDATGRYRGSSIFLFESGRGDASARSVLFNDGDAREYQCCL